MAKRLAVNNFIKIQGEIPMLDQLASKIDIQKRLAQHARGIDRADEALLRTAYHEDGTVDYGSLQGTAAVFANAIATMHTGLPMSTHRPSNILIKIDGDEAVSESYVAAFVTLSTDGEPQPHLVCGRYLDRHTRKNGEWRMQHRQYVLEWIKQFPAPQAAGEKPAFNLAHMVPTGGHGTSDPGNALMLALASDKKKDQGSSAMSDTSAALDKVLSHQAIVEVGAKYCRGVDRGCPDTIMEAFHDDASIVSGAFNGNAKEFSVEIGKLLDQVSPRVMHTVTNHWIEIDGDNAVGESYVFAYQLVQGDDPQDSLTGGRYIDKYERRNGVWKISHRTFVMDWNDTSPSKDLMSLGMFEAMVKGTRGKEDPVFALWDSLG